MTGNCYNQIEKRKLGFLTDIFLQFCIDPLVLIRISRHAQSTRWYWCRQLPPLRR